MDKIALRARLRATRDAFALDHPGLAIAPGKALTALLHGTIATYAPMTGEADPAPIDAVARAAGCRIALPFVVDRARPLRFLAWNGEALIPGPFGLRNPPPDAAEIAPDVILTPLVGFDRAMNRLGQGAGHYDRAFAAFPDAVRIGVAWSVQAVDALPADPWDVPLHAVQTERGWITA